MSATDTKKEEESEYCVVSEAEDCFTDDELSRSTEAQNVKSCNELKRIGSDLEEGELLELEEDISNECTTTTIHPERVQASPLSKYCCKDPEYKSDYKCYGRINSGDARRSRDFNSEFRSRNSGSEETWKRSGHGNHYENYRSSHVNNSGESSRSRWRTERSENVFRDRDDYRGDYGEPNRNHSRARSPLHRSVSGGRPLPYSRPSYDESTSYDRRDSWHRESSYKRSRRAYESGNGYYDSPSRRRRHTPSYFYGSDSSSSSIERPTAKLRRLSKERSTTSRSSIRSNHPESLSSYKSERSVSRSASPPYSERRKSFSRGSTSSDSSSLSKVDVRLTAKAVRAVLRRNDFQVHSNSSTGENSEYESEKSDESDVDEEEIEEVEEDEIDEEERKEKEEEEEEADDDDDDDDDDNDEEEEEEEDDDDDEDDGDDDSNEKRRQHSANAVSHEAPLTTLNDSKREKTHEFVCRVWNAILITFWKNHRPEDEENAEKESSRGFTNIPLHDLWKKYILSLGSDECLLKADYHGAVLLVSHSKCQSQVGLFGIVVIETKHAFLLLTPKDRLLTIPKKGSIFTFVLKGHVYSLIGDHICYTAAGRVQKKFKLAHLTSMPDFIDDLLPHVN
ncbi:Ribonuclease P protein subunit [Trichinella pseudospiralis]